MKEALLYGKKDKKQVQCNLCAHRCIIADGRLGICAVRKNKDGILYSLSYGQLLSSNVDPIEKKPLFHFKPGHSSYSIATAGCNLKCDFCQNWQISQKAESDRLGVNPSFTAPEDIIKKAKDTGCRSIAYTYTEPTVFFEYALDVSRMARQGGIYNVFVTNGFMTKECLDMMDGLLDAANVDLKSFRDDYYRRLCAGSLKPVLESIERMKKIGVWVEVTTLIVPGMNDSPRELRDIALFIAGIDKGIPWHISRFYPQYKKENLPPTPMTTLKSAFDIAKEAGLEFVYLGNCRGEGENTFCPGCGKLLIEREGYFIRQNNISSSGCPKCSTPIPGIY